MSNATAIRLERVQAALSVGRQPGPDDLAWFLKVDPENLPGGNGLKATAQIVFEFARNYGFSAQKIWIVLERYERSAWPRERMATECPPPRRGRPEEFAWHSLRTYGRAPSEKTIRRMLDQQIYGQVKGELSKAAD